MVGLITAIILIPMLGAVAMCTWPPLRPGYSGQAAQCSPDCADVSTSSLPDAPWRCGETSTPPRPDSSSWSVIPGFRAYQRRISGGGRRWPEPAVVLLTSLIIPFAFLAQPPPDRSRAFYATMLVMQAALYGM